MSKIYTSRYANPELAGDKYYTVGISLGKPKFRIPYRESDHCYAFAPDRSFFYLPDDQFDERYLKKLESMGAQRVKSILDILVSKAGDKDVVLLCFEDVRNPEEECHRTAFAAWCNANIGTDIQELFDPTVPKSKRKPEKAEPEMEQMSLF